MRILHEAGSDRGVAFFVDASPSEQFYASHQGKVAFVATTCFKPEGIPITSGFKQTRRKRKWRSATRLATFLRDDPQSVLAIGLVAEHATLLAISETTLGAVCDQIRAQRHADGAVSWNGARYSEPLARGVAVYASFLTSALILMAHAFTAQRLSGWECSFLIDRLPHEGDGLRAMNLLEAICKSPYVISTITDRLPDQETSFGCGYVADIASKQGAIWEGKSIPGTILADWLARGLRAKHDPIHFADTELERPFTEDELAAFSSVWHAAKDHHEVHEYDLDARAWLRG
jgi:hypothetical protein